MLNRIRAFLEEVRGELKRVSWPKRDELTRSTSVVLVMILATALIIGLLDFIFNTFIVMSLGAR